MPKRAKRTVLDGECREFVVRLRDYFERELQNGGPLLPLSLVCDRVADALGIGRATVSRITKEKFGDSSMEENKLTTPNKIRKKRCPITDVDDFNAAAIRNHVNTYYTRNESPTLTKLAVSLKSENLFNGSLPSLSKLLKKIGFSFKNSNKRNIEMAPTDIDLAHTDFLHREQFKVTSIEENKLPNKEMENPWPLIDIDDYKAAAIRNHVYAYYTRNDMPTLTKLAVSLKDASLFNGNLPSLSIILKKIGFSFKKCDDRNIKIEPTDIALPGTNFERIIKTEPTDIPLVGTDFESKIKIEPTDIVLAGTNPLDEVKDSKNWHMISFFDEKLRNTDCTES